MSFCYWSAAPNILKQRKIRKEMEKTFNAGETEARITAQWEEIGAFEAGANAKPGSESFCIMIRAA